MAAGSRFGAVMPAAMQARILRQIAAVVSCEGFSRRLAFWTTADFCFADQFWRDCRSPRPCCPCAAVRRLLQIGTHSLRVWHSEASWIARQWL